MKQFRKMSIRITHLVLANGQSITELHTKGAAAFTIEEFVQAMNSARNTHVKEIIQRKEMKVKKEMPGLSAVKGGQS